MVSRHLSGDKVQEFNFQRQKKMKEEKTKTPEKMLLGEQRAIMVASEENQ